MFTLSEEHILLRDAAKSFVEDKLPTTHLRKLREAGEGFDPGVWAEMAAMGWAGVLVGEDEGGSDLGYVGMGLVLEALGRTLGPSPLLSTGLIGACALRLGGTAAQKAQWLAKIAAGEIITALAIDDGAHHAPEKPKATVSGGKLNGAKLFVADGAGADLFIVSARTDAGPALFLVPATAAGVKVTALHTVDSRAAADVQFTDVQISEDQRLGDGALIGRVLDRARLGLAAEMLGQAQASFEITSDYLKTRTQFGQLIGSFQALQHRAAKLFVEIELCRSAVMAGLSLIDAGESDEKIAEAASMAKSLMGDTLHTMSNEMVQMHGGIGMTDAHDSGLYLKRARVQEALYGSASFHRARYAALNGF